MATILENVATDNLEARYKEALKTVLSESTTATDTDNDLSDSVANGDKIVVESQENGSAMSIAEKERLRKLIG
jgi:hypothetical protein